MNIRRLDRLLLVLPFLWHLYLVFGSFFFVSPEISLYPYFVSKGLLPYIHIIDQHFPLLFFGPLNLSQISINSPSSVLILFIAIIGLTDLGFLLNLVRTTKNLLSRFFLFWLFVNSQIILAGYHLWIESFALLFIVWSIYYLNSSGTIKRGIGAVLLSLVIGLRPTLSPLILAVLYLQNFITPLSLLILSIVPSLELFWLVKNHLLEDFLITLDFNTSYYLPLASKLPSFREILLTFVVFLHLFLNRPSIKIIILFLFASAAAYPRFELYHLLPVVGLLSLILESKTNLKLLAFLFLITSLLVVYLRRPFQPTNFYYSTSLDQIATQIQVINSTRHSIYFFGGPDQLYQLTNTLPPSNLYLPSLPWYLANEQYVKKQIKALQSDRSALVAINRESQLNGISLLDYGQPIWQFIQQNYIFIDQIGPLSLYRRR